MNIYKATVIKTGNSYALRVPKAYADDNKLNIGQKVEITSPKKTGKQYDRNSLVKAIKELHKIEAFKSIKDPAAWQREIRKDRPLPGRD